MNNDDLKLIWEQYNFPGYYKFYKILKELNHEMLYKDVQKFVKNQKIHKQHTQTIKRHHGFIDIVNKNFQWFCDLVDYQKYQSKNKHYNYILVVIDAYSRIAYTEAIKNKESKTVSHAFEKILNEAGCKPKILTSDNGSEFIASDFKNMLTSHDITQNLSEVGDHYSLGIIDRFCRTLKSTIYKYFTMNDNKLWIDIYKDIVKKYNDTDNEALGFIAPNETDIYPLNIYIAHMKKVRASQKTNENKMIYNVGNYVKKRMRKDSVFHKAYEPVWSKRTYKILEIKGRSYMIDDDTDVLYRQYDLLLVDTDEDNKEEDEQEDETEDETPIEKKKKIPQVIIPREKSTREKKTIDRFIF